MKSTQKVLCYRIYLYFEDRAPLSQVRVQRTWLLSFDSMYCVVTLCQTQLCLSVSPSSASDWSNFITSSYYLIHFFKRPKALHAFGSHSGAGYLKIVCDQMEKIHLIYNANIHAKEVQLVGFTNVGLEILQKCKIRINL